MTVSGELEQYHDSFKTRCSPPCTSSYYVTLNFGLTSHLLGFLVTTVTCSFLGHLSTINNSERSKVVVAVVRRQRKGASDSFSLTVHVTATKPTAVLYHIECTQGLDKVRLDHDWLQLLRAD